MLLLLLAACGADECVVTRSDVADDAPLGNLPYTAGDVAAEGTGTFDVTVDTPNDGPVPVTLDTRRGDGSAVYEEARFKDGLAFDDVWIFSQDYELRPACLDSVEVPMLVALDVPDLGMSLVFDGMAEPPLGSLEALEGVGVYARLPVDHPGLPTPPEGATEVSFQSGILDGELVRLRLAWTTEDDSYVIVELPEE